MLYTGPICNVKFKKELVFEYDSPLPEWMVEVGEKSFYRFPFEYNHHVHDGDEKPFFGKQLYHQDYGVDPVAPPFVYILTQFIESELIYKIDSECRYKNLFRIIVNGQTSSNSPAAHMDDDVNRDMWTLLYYVTDSSGDTVFYDKQSNQKEVYRTKYKKGKIVVFPSSFMHQALAPEDGWRVSIGVMFKMETALNKFIFSEKN